MRPEPAMLEWLLDSDPALRWQVERDLVGAPSDVWLRTRARVATEGFGSRLVALQDADGQWAGGAFFPAGFDFDGPEAAPGAGQPWTANTWPLNTLRDWGVDAPAPDGTAGRLAANSRWEYNDEPCWRGEVDACINALTLANGAWLGADVSGIAQRRLSTGEIVAPWVHRFAYPLRSYFSVLKAADYFREAARHDGIPPDPRLAEAIETIRAARQPDGTWHQGRRDPGRAGSRSMCRRASRRNGSPSSPRAC